MMIKLYRLYRTKDGLRPEGRAFKGQNDMSVVGVFAKTQQSQGFLRFKLLFQVHSLTCRRRCLVRSACKMSSLGLWDLEVSCGNC